jgi:hypothetical protein
MEAGLAIYQMETGEDEEIQEGVVVEAGPVSWEVITIESEAASKIAEAKSKVWTVVYACEVTM